MPQLQFEIWAAIIFVMIASILLSFEDMSSLQFSWGSVYFPSAAFRTFHYRFDRHGCRYILRLHC